MRKIIAFAFLMPLLFACGEEGLTFNLSTDFATPPASFNVPIPTLPDGLPDIGALDADPPSESISYSLGSVDAFSGDLDQLGGVLINSLAYEISGIEGAEQNILLDEFSIEMVLGPNRFTLLSIMDGPLANVPKSDIQITESQKQEISDYLFSGQELGAEIVFDLQEIPTGLTSLNMDFVMYFDVTVKIDRSID